MDDHYTSAFTEEERAARRQQRMAARRAKQQARRRRQLRVILPCGLLAILLVSLLLGSKATHTQDEPDNAETAGIDLAAADAITPTPLW